MRKPFDSTSRSSYWLKKVGDLDQAINSQSKEFIARLQAYVEHG